VEEVLRAERFLVTAQSVMTDAQSPDRHLSSWTALCQTVLSAGKNKGTICDKPVLIGQLTCVRHVSKKEVDIDPNDLSTNTVDQLKLKAVALGLALKSKINKTDLIALINSHNPETLDTLKSKESDEKDEDVEVEIEDTPTPKPVAASARETVQENFKDISLSDLKKRCIAAAIPVSKKTREELEQALTNHSKTKTI
jgi:hypothetical protein